MKFKHYFFPLFVIIIFSACTHKEDISGKVEGIWETDWDDILSGDLDDISVNEVIVFEAEGTFQQIFSGSVKYDDWENETKVSYLVAAGGHWHVKKPDNIVLQYDMNQFAYEIGNIDVEADYTDAAIGLITGDWGDVMSGLIKGSNTTKINKKVEDEMNEQIPKYFKEMFREMNKDKKAFSDVTISSGTLSATVNRGFFGTDLVYDKKNSDQFYDNASSGKSSNSNASAVTAADKTENQSSLRVDEDTQDDWIVEFDGSIGKYPIKMFLNLKNINDNDRCEIEGKHCYLSSGSGRYLNLFGVKEGDSLELSEYNDKKEITGTFDGVFSIFGNMDSFEYTGTFTNYAGKSFEFSLSSTN